MGEEVFLANGVDEQVVVVLAEITDGFPTGNAPEGEIVFDIAEGGILVCDHKVDVLVLKGDEPDALALVFHVFGKMIEHVPVLLVVETADEADTMNLHNVADTLVARGCHQLSDGFAAADVFDEFEHMMNALMR